MERPERMRWHMAAVTLAVLALLAAQWSVLSDQVREASQTAVLNAAIVTTALGVGANAWLLARFRADVRASTRRVTAQLSAREQTGVPAGTDPEHHVVLTVAGATHYHRPGCPLITHKDVRRAGGPHDPARRACGMCLDG